MVVENYDWTDYVIIIVCVISLMTGGYLAICHYCRSCCSPRNPIETSPFNLQTFDIIPYRRMN